MFHLPNAFRNIDVCRETTSTIQEGSQNLKTSEQETVPDARGYKPSEREGLGAVELYTAMLGVLWVHSQGQGAIGGIVRPNERGHT